MGAVVHFTTTETLVDGKLQNSWVKVGNISFRGDITLVHKTNNYQVWYKERGREQLGYDSDGRSLGWRHVPACYMLVRLWGNTGGKHFPNLGEVIQDEEPGRGMAAEKLRAKYIHDANVLETILSNEHPWSKKSA